MAQDWDIKARGSACSGCQAAFADKQDYHSALIIAEGKYQRADFCVPCWSNAEPNLGPYSSWKGVFKAPPPKPEEPLRKENAEELLRRLMADEPEKRKNVIFILAVMLERTRVVVERDVQLREDGHLIRMYEHRKTGESFVILDPGLRFNQLEEVEAEVMEMLGIKPKGAATADGTAAPAQAGSEQAPGDAQAGPPSGGEGQAQG
jgi:hypothetical protein